MSPMTPRFVLIVASLLLSLSAVAGTVPSKDDPTRVFAATPQMGYNNWYTTYCHADFNEQRIRDMVDRMVELGMKDLGYEYVNLDDCWARPERDAKGNLVVNTDRFPSGLKALGAYVHAHGFKFGIYTSAGTHTCADTKDGGFPGGLGHEKEDAALFASFDVDYVKYDNCHNEKVDAKKRYRAMGEALRATGRAMFYSLCEWGENKPWLWGAEPDVGASSWRTTLDIEDKFPSMRKVFEENVVLDKYAGPGHWNDPDILQVGIGGMGDVEYRTQFSLWSIMAAPLLVSADLRKASPATLEILRNKDVIAIDQDTLGVQGKRVRHDGDVHVIVKPLANGDRAVAVFNGGEKAQSVTVKPSEWGAKAGAAYTARDLWMHTDASHTGALTADVPPHATVIYRIASSKR